MQPVWIHGIGAVTRGGIGVGGLRQALLDHGAGAPPSDAELRQACRAVAPGVSLPAAARLALLAVHEALAGLPPMAGTGIVAGTCYANLGPIETFRENAATAGVRLASPLLFPDTVMNAAAGHVAALLRLHGPTATISTGLVAGGMALAHARSLLEEGHANRLVVCGFDVVPPAAVARLAGGNSPPYTAGCGALSLELGDEPPPDGGRARLRGLAYAPGRLDEVGAQVIARALEQAECTHRDLEAVFLTGRTGDSNDPLGVQMVAGLWDSRRLRAEVRSLLRPLGDTMAASAVLGVVVARLEPATGPALVLDYDLAGVCAMVLTDA